MNVKLGLGAISLALSLNAMAVTMDSFKDDHHPWSMIGGLGYAWYKFGYDSDGQTSIGRFAIGRDIGTFKSLNVGLELGYQTGNQMRLDISQTTLDKLGGLPIQTTIKPMLDLLISAKTATLTNIPVFGIAKIGVAYRRLEVNDQETVNDLSEAACEIQAGFGYGISNRASLALLYQGIFNGNTDFTVNTANNTGHISNIPNQNGVLLTLSYKV